MRAFGRAGTGNSGPMGISEVLTGIERARALDRPATAARTAVQRVLRNPAVKDALHGVWLGHPLHPALAQFTLGSFVSASVLDGVGGRQRESSTLIAAGLAATVPTVAAGWADYADGHEEQQRVGIVHAALNATAVACYAAALLSRSQGRSGRAASLAGGALAGLGAHLGGHLSFRRGLGPNQAESVPHTASGDWQPLGPLADIPDGEPVARDAAGTAVLVVRRGEQVDVWADRCPHLSAPLHEGELDCAAGSITCPWHGSAFRVDDGSVLHGPATAPLPGFDSRVVDGVLQARVRTFPGVPAS
jgi:nitrite reductase/ring-hydroxylating ferredoxin subunit/uncharacterized membrane protein